MVSQVRTASLRQGTDDYLFRATFENVAVGIAHVALDGTWLRVNQRLCDIVGYGRDELLEITFQQITHPDDLESDLEQLQKLIRGEIPGYQMEKRYYRKDGALIWINLTVALQRDEDGSPLFCISVVEDITARKHYEEQLKVALEELNHRVRNTLTIVRAIATLAMPDEALVQEARPDFLRRIEALANAHSLLTAEKWVGARIGDTVTSALSPYDIGSRFDADGPEAWLPSKPAVSLALTLNELATNALKHGALKHPDGRVSLRWNVAPDDGGRRVEFTWCESGGPPVSKPTRRGFGMTLINGLLRSEMRGSADLGFEPGGLQCRLSFIAAGAMAEARRVQ